jgi:DeoR family transcriptional regulator, fructose operon transcriptional repressor
MTSINSRHQYIMNQVEIRGSVNVADLAKSLDVSEMTIRRDFRELENQGLIRRFHGGAVSSRGRSYEPPLVTRSGERTKEKELIGKFAAQLVAEGDSIALDVGSTIFQVAENMDDIKNITVITPSLPIASLFYDRSDVRVILPGGTVRPSENSLVGDLARSNLEKFFVDRLFLGAGGVHSENGITEYNTDDALVKQAMIRNAKEVILVADSSKFQKTTFAYVGSFKEINQFITEAKPPEDLFNVLKANDVAINIVEK